MPRIGRWPPGRLPARPGILALSCDDGEGLNFTTTGPTQSSYTSKARPLVEELDGIRIDFDGLLKVWNATKNISYAASTTRQLHGRASAVRPKIEALKPPTRSQSAHAHLVKAAIALESSLQHGLRFFDSNGIDKDALLQANIQIVNYNKSIEQFSG